MIILDGLAWYPVNLSYWTGSDHRYEIDFLLQYGTMIIPIAVTSEGPVSSPSLKAIERLHAEDVPSRVRYSLQNLKLDGDILNIPLFMADFTDRLIALALDALQ